MVATRRSARLASTAVEAPPAKEAPKEAPPAKEKAPKAEKVAAPPKSEKASPPKKAKATKAKTKKTKAESKKKDAAEAEPKEKAAVEAEPKKKKKATSSKKASDGKDKPVVTVEASKKWGAFQTRANKISKAVGDRAFVEINKEKPGNGNFIVTIEGIDEPIVSLLGMNRPFPALKALDMDEINQKILKALEQ